MRRYVAGEKLSQQCKKCDSKINPIEVKVSGHYSHFKCPVCGADVSSNRGKGVLALIGIGLIAWALAFAYRHLAG
ncbi:hypothetical protein [Pseudoalteromonas byunsanensis]|uniref:Uncharacterized protein n=1 Tax=Pseudoalteromonas byunsanensis TaxID=327939 RepID=A0A1S1N6U8_9GAMM|nr:hypothetical protein [Pseudoalteromonas byunsanensis]OHU94382.1 hypothetical protein BIW53_15000 [Pseudoalteromonas byunsanensis]